MARQAPLTVQSNAPLELVQEFFVKLGARYVVVTDANGLCERPLLFVSDCVDRHGLDEGVIDKKTWLHFITELSQKSH